MREPWNLAGMKVGPFFKRVAREFQRDNILDAGAALGYYFMLALFPLLIFLLSLLSVLQLDVIGRFLGMLSQSMPPAAYDLLGGEISRILSQDATGILTFGAFGTLWAASSGVVSLIDGLNRAYGVNESRGYFMQRVLSVGLTFALASLIIVGSVLLMTGDLISGFLVDKTGLDWLDYVGPVVNYALGLGLMFLGLELVYFFGPNVPDQKWKWVSPGSLVGVVLFVASSFGFSLYVRFAGSYDATYGSIGAVIVLMLWLYLLGLAILIGGEVNADIAHVALEYGIPDAPMVPSGSDVNSVRDIKEAAGTKLPDEGVEYASSSRIFKPIESPVFYERKESPRHYHRGRHGTTLMKKEESMTRLVRKSRSDLSEIEEISYEDSRQPWRPWIGTAYLAGIGLLAYLGLETKARRKP